MFCLHVHSVCTWCPIRQKEAVRGPGIGATDNLDSSLPFQVLCHLLGITCDHIYSFFSLVGDFISVLLETGPLYPGWPGTSYVDQDGPTLIENSLLLEFPCVILNVMFSRILIAKSGLISSSLNPTGPATSLSSVIKCHCFSSTLNCKCPLLTMSHYLRQELVLFIFISKLFGIEWAFAKCLWNRTDQV